MWTTDQLRQHVREGATGAVRMAVDETSVRRGAISGCRIAFGRGAKRGSAPASDLGPRLHSMRWT